MDDITGVLQGSVVEEYDWSFDEEDRLWQSVEDAVMVVSCQCGLGVEVKLILDVISGTVERWNFSSPILVRIGPP